LFDIAAHSVLRDSQKLQTSKHGQPHTIQIVRAYARDLTMGAARTGLAPGRIIIIITIAKYNTKEI